MNCQSKPEIVPKDVYGLNFTVTGLSFSLKPGYLTDGALLTN